jgi:hypothetical protein
MAIGVAQRRQHPKKEYHSVYDRSANAGIHAALGVRDDLSARLVSLTDTDWRYAVPGGGAARRAG